MKILAIRGCNLASLAGEFEIDLARGALGGAGVFAIVGNTGAGKSTLLDALCVALFDRTPRLTNHSRVVVGRGAEDPAALGAQDVRTLLRRGAAQGWAEVDFESGDTRRYRARWSVRRARGHVDGTLQAQQVSLTALDGGERLGGTKTETLQAIQARLGLSFEQFRRSALLAQGEFAAFLRAEGKDRSELLERMTGTEIYSRLSIAAHLRATLAEQRLAAGRTAALAIAVLDDDARRAAEAELGFAEAAKRAARERHAAAEDAARWVAEATRRAAALTAATADLRTAEAALVTAAPLRTELELRRRAEALRAPWEDAERAERQASIAFGELASAHRAADAATHEATVLGGYARVLSELEAPLREARIAVGLVERAAPGTARTSVGRVDSADLVERAERVARGAHVDAEWLMQRRALAVEVAGWAELDLKFAAHASTIDAIVMIDRELAEHAVSATQLSVARDAAASERQEAAARHAEAQRKADSFQKRRGLSLDAARRQEDEARTRLAEVERLGAIAKDAASAHAALGVCAARAVELDTETEADRVARTTAEASIVTARTLRVERTRALDELRRAAGYEHARTELVDGDPCPLCGAIDHPWRDRGAFDELIAAATTRLAEVGETLDAATATVASLDARASAREPERARLGAQRDAAASAVAQATAAWAEHLTALGELSLVRDPVGAEADRLARELRGAAAKRLEEARTTRSATEAALKAAAEAQAEVQLGQANLDALATKLVDLERRRADLASTIERLHGQRTERSARLAELTALLATAIATWTTLAAGGDPDQHAGGASAPHAAVASSTHAVAASAPPRANAARTTPPQTGAAKIAKIAKPRFLGPPARESSANAVSAFPRVLLGDLGDLGGSPSEGDAHPNSIAPRADAYSPHATDARAPHARGSSHAARTSRGSTAADQLPPRLDHQRAWIAEVADGWRARADRVARVEAEINAGLGVVAAELRLAEAARVEHAARRLELERRHAELAATLEVARRGLAAASSEAGFAVDELRALLATEGAGATRIDALVEQLAALERAVERTRAITAERRALVDTHAAARPAGPFAVDAGGEHPATRETELAAVRAAVESAVAQSAGLLAAAEADVARRTALLAADTDARTRRAEALAQLEAAEGDARIDRILGEVIGSHDGKRFRAFAQSLTLDGLLALANAHLDELAPRYQLERVPGHDLELQVIDRELGDEVRSVQSLSGGESFLASLALALGLSSMSAHDVRVRTLLIDEGFGTLDPGTLDSALSVLDALQARGRQVGVISHVPQLVERVGACVRVVQRGGGRSEVVVA